MPCINIAAVNLTVEVLWITFDLIQAGYRGHLHGRPHILQIPSSEWNYGETQNLPCKTEQRWNKQYASADAETWEEISAIFIMHIGVKKKNQINN